MRGRGGRDLGAHPREHLRPRLIEDGVEQSGLSSEITHQLRLRTARLPRKKDGEVREKLSELRYLRGSMGKTGELALAPLLRDVWQLHMLE